MVDRPRPELRGHCEKCPLNGQPLVRGNGPWGGLVVVGEAPGATEVSRDAPFVGEAGQLLRATFRSVGVKPEDVYYTNACLCRPPGNATPNALAVQCCNDRLFEELAMVKAEKVLAVGGTALTAVRGSGPGITASRGGMFYAGAAYPAVATWHPAAIMRNPDYFRDASRDIEKLLRQDKPQVPTCDLWVPSSTSECLDMLAEISKAQVISCDLETTIADLVVDQEITCWGFGVLEGTRRGRVAPYEIPQGVSVAIPRRYLREARVLRVLHDILMDPRHIIPFHNLKADLSWIDQLFQEYVRPPGAWDTMLHQYSLDERTGEGVSHGLKDIARVYYDAEDYRFDFKRYETETEEEWWPDLSWYNALDCYYTVRLFFDLTMESMAEDEGREVGSVDLVRKILTPGAIALKEIERTGALIDRPYLTKLGEEYTAELTKERAHLSEMSGIPDFNPNSPLQMRKLVFETWGLKKGHNSRYEGAESTSKESLQHLTKTTKDPAILEGLSMIMDYRLKSKAVSTYVNGILKRLDKNDRVHSDFRIHGTETGRLSSRDPNLQNIPVLMGPAIRRAFIVPEDHLFLEADYGQLELRVAAYFSGDEAMIQAFKDERDIHREVASAMFGVPQSAVTDYQRYLAKYVDFGIVYGRTAKSLTEGWEMEEMEQKGLGKRWTVDQAETFLQNLLNGFPRLRDWMRMIARQTLKDQYVQTPLGRTRRFPYIPPGMQNGVGRQAVNTPIQGTASDICLIALTRLNSELPDGASILFTVHDSIAFEVHESLFPDIVPFIKEIMSNSLPFETDIPFVVDFKAGKSWGDAKKIA